MHYAIVSSSDVGFQLKSIV